MTRLLYALLDVFVPTSCVGCKAAGSLFCSGCRANLVIRPRNVVRANLQGWAACELDKTAAALVISYKDQGRTALLPFLSNQMASAYWCFHSTSEASEITVVAAPSSVNGYHRRGYHAGELIASAFARRIGAKFCGRAIRLNAGTRDQRQLGAKGRALNLRNSMEARSGLGQVLLVDDVVTSGATIAEATRALEQAGNTVVGFICFAETPYRGP